MSEEIIKKNNFSKRYFLLIIFIPIILWSLAFPFIKIGLKELSPVNLTIMRLFVVCIVFLILLFVKPKRFSKLEKRDVIPIFLLGFFGIVIYNLGLNYGEQFISASAASVIIATIPIFVVILAIIFLKEKITSKIILGVSLSLIGVIIISTVGSFNTPFEIKYISGAFAVLIASLMGAFYTVAGKKMLQRYSALSLTVYVILLGSLGLIPFISASLFKELLSMSIVGWSVVIFLGIFPTIFGYVFWFAALEIKKASEISVYLYFIPILSTIISYFLFLENITLFFIFGGFLVIVGLLIVNKQYSKSS